MSNYNYVDKYKISDKQLTQIENVIRYKKSIFGLIPTLLTDYYINTIYNNTDLSSFTYLKGNPVLCHYAQGITDNYYKSIPYYNNFWFTNVDLTKQMSVGLGINQYFLLSSQSDCYNWEENRAYYFEANEWGTPLIKGYIYNRNAYLYNTSPNAIEVSNAYIYNMINADQRPLFVYTGE